MSELGTDIPTHDVSGLAMRLPQGSIDEIIGLLKILARLAFAQRLSLADLSDTVRYDQERLLSVLELLGILGFAEVSGGAVRLTRAGRLYARASDHERKTVFAGQLAQRIPLAAYVRDVLEAHPAHRLALCTMLVDLQQRFAIADADVAMRTVIAWARYAGFFFYDELSGLLSLEQSALARHPPQRMPTPDGGATP
jgi:NitT/TauT family transport system ATP-binding protein